MHNILLNITYCCYSKRIDFVWIFDLYFTEFTNCIGSYAVIKAKCMVKYHRFDALLMYIKS
jgi:hypothetical protein